MDDLFSVGGLSVERGQKARGFLRLSENNDGSVLDTPLLVVHGAENGPRLWLTALVHGDEYEGIQALLAVYEALNPAELKGTFVGVSVANPLAYAALARATPQDGLNLNRVFPGEPNGTVTMRMAHSLFTAISQNADFHLDLHGGGLALQLYPHAIYHDYGEAGQQGRAMALASGRDLIAVSRGDEAKGLLYAELTLVGVPSIIVECGGSGMNRNEYASRHKDGILAIMNHLGILSGSVTRPARQRIIEKSEKLYAPSAGLVFFSVVAGSDVNEGDDLGQILGTDGAVKSVLRATSGGVLTWCRHIPPIWPGELIASVRHVAEVVENDEEALQ
jgi:predicted deacylase